MAILKATIKTGGQSIKQTYTGAYIRVVTQSGGSVHVDRYPIYNISGSVTYCVLTDDPNIADFSILNSTAIPKLGDQYHDQNGVAYNGVYYQDNTARFIGALGSGYLWEVVYQIAGNYSEPPEETEDSETILSFSASVELQDEARAVDLNGVYNVNSIGLFFDDPLLIKTGILNLNYQRREYSNPLSTIIAYSNYINSVAMWGFAIGTVRVASITANITTTETSTAYDVAYALQYNPRGWNTQKANSSYYYYSGSALTRALNTDGSPSESPVFIALDGTKLASNVAPLWRSFQVYPAADLTALGLPDPFLM